jgi:hypothetical protein
MVFDECADYVQRKVKLANAIFGLAPSYLVRVFEKGRRFGNRMPILRQVRSVLFSVELRIKIGDHLARDPLILNVGIAICEAAPLFPELIRGHFDFASALNEFL